MPDLVDGVFFKQDSKNSGIGVAILNGSTELLTVSLNHEGSSLEIMVYLRYYESS